MRAEPSLRSKEPSLEELLRVWGLRRAPFSADDKSGELFDTGPLHRDALALLDTTAALRGVMMLTGAPGTGKSTLIRTWIGDLEPKRFLPILITQSSLSATGVLETLLTKLGLRASSRRAANLLALEKHLVEIEPVTLVLVLDDAQNYPAPALEELRLLLGIGGRHRSAFSFILLGDEYLLGSMRLSVQRALYSRISAAAVLDPLPRERIDAYLDWQISRAGLDRQIFNPAAINLLAEASEGNPRILGLLAQAAWLDAARHNSLTIEPVHVHCALQQVPAANAKVASPSQLK